jgi:hypothetical protein
MPQLEIFSNIFLGEKSHLWIEAIPQLEIFGKK